jgi:hypothetical protein
VTPRFTTLRVGVRTMHLDGQAFEFDVRVLLDEGGGYRVYDWSLSAPLPSLDAAVALAHAPEPVPEGATFELRWRDPGAPLGPDEGPCPVCAAPAFASARYPRCLCPACVLEATDAPGRPLRFGNIDLSGGLTARHADDGSPYQGVECFVRGVRCRAEEHRFGGIVVQPVGGRAV